MTIHNSTRTQSTTIKQKTESIAATEESQNMEFTPLNQEDIMYLKLHLRCGVEAKYIKSWQAFDGFMHAIAVGPETLEPQRWLHRLLGPVSTVNSAAQARSILKIKDLAIRHLKTIHAELEKEQPRVNADFSAIFDKNNEFICQDGAEWSNGFMSWVRFSFEEWQPLLSTIEGREILSPMALIGEENQYLDSEKLKRSYPVRSNITKQIRQAVYDIYVYWRESRDE